MYRGRLSPGKVLRLLAWAPDDGPFAASLQGGKEFLGRGSLWHAVADLWDVEVAVAHGQGGGKGKPPTRPRPGDKTRAGRRTRREELSRQAPGSG